MIAFNCPILFGLLVHLVSCDVSLTIGTKQPQTVRSEQQVRSNYESPRGYEYSGSYSTVAPENKAQYVSSYSTGAPEIKYVGSYTSAAPELSAQYVGSYSTGSPDSSAQYVGSYSTAAPENKAAYSSGASDNKAQYVASYSSGASDNKAQYVGSYSTAAPENKAQYVGSYSSGASDDKAQYVGSYSTLAPENKAQYVGSYSTAAPENKAQYVGSYSSGASGNKAQYVGSYSTGTPDNKAQYASGSSSSRSSYDPYPSGQISSEQNSYSAKQEYNPQYQNDRGVLLISKELQVPFVASKTNEETSDGCDEANDRKVNQQVQVNEDVQVNENVQNNEDVQVNENVQNNENVQSNQNDENENVPSVEATKPVYKTSRYEVRRPGIRKEFYDIEEKVLIRPAGTAVFELQHDKPHSSAIVNKHIYQQQSYPQSSYPQSSYPQSSYPQSSYPQSSYPPYSDEESQYYPQDQQYANHGYHPVIIQSAPSVPSIGYDYNTRSPPRPHTTYPNTQNYNPVYPSTAITPSYVPPVAGGYLPPCDDTPNVPTKPHPPSSQHEFSDEYDDNHDYESDAAFITPINEDNQETADIKYASSKSTNSNREREYYRQPQRQQQSTAYYPESRIDRLRVEYQNPRGDLAQLKANQYPQQFHQEYVPNFSVDRKQVQIRPNGDASAKYSREKVSSQVEVENSQKLLDLYSANGDVTEIGFNGGAKSQQFKAPASNSRVVSVTPAPQFANYVDEQTKSRRVVLSKPLYTVQQVEVREHNHRLVEDVQHDNIEPKVSEFEKLRLVGNAFGSQSSSSSRNADINQEFEYVTPVPQAYAHLRAGTPVPETLQK